MARNSVKILLAGLLAFAGFGAHAQTAYPLFAPADGVLVGDSNTFVTTAAASSNIRVLWTGSCTAATFLRGDGACSTIAALGAALTKTDDTNVTMTLGGTPSTAVLTATSMTLGWNGQLSAARGGTGLSTVTDDTALVANGTTWVSTAIPNCTDTTGNHLNYTAASNSYSCGTTAPGGFTGFANPTASLGLTAINGSAVTAMRSDAAPALNVGIVPTWTGNHTFSNALPRLFMNNTAAAVDTKAWEWRVNTTGTIALIADTDVFGGALTPFSISRTAVSANPVMAIDVASVTNTGGYVGMGSLGVPGLANNSVVLGAGTAGGKIKFVSSGGAANAKTVEFAQSATTFLLRTVDDTDSATSNILVATRSGVSTTDLSFGNATSNPSYTFLGTNQILASAGTAANPTYSFAADPDTGMYRVGADEIGFSQAGATTLHLVAAASSAMTARLDAGQLGVTDGTFTAPTYSFVSDPDTGIYRFAANSMAFTTGGVFAGAFNSLQQLVVLDGSTGQPSVSFNSDSDTGLYHFAANSFGFVGNGAFIAGVSPGQIRLVDGVVGTPAYTFDSDLDTGFYRTASGRVSFSSDNSQVFQLQQFTSGGAVVADFVGTLQTVGFREVPQNAQTANYTLVLGDSGKHIYHASGAGAGDTYTIPSNASIPYALGTTLTFVNSDSNAVSIAITTDTLTLGGTTTTGTRTLSQNGVATAIKVTTTSWIITGTGIT